MTDFPPAKKVTGIWELTNKLNQCIATMNLDVSWLETEKATAYNDELKAVADIRREAQRVVNFCQKFLIENQ